MIQILCKKYDARGLAFRITYQSDIRTTDDYQEALDEACEQTMSCNRQEAIKWLVNMMEEAIRYGIATQDKGWKSKFLAAYDICESI